MLYDQVDGLIDELDRQLDAFLVKVREDLIADDTFPQDQLPRAMAEISVKLAAHRATQIAGFERSTLHVSQIH